MRIIILCVTFVIYSGRIFLYLCKIILFVHYRNTMARGQQKIQSQQKAAEKAAKLKKQVGGLGSCFIIYFCLSNVSSFQQGNSKHDNLKTAMAGLKMSCGVCKSLMPDPKTYKQVQGRLNLVLRNYSIFDLKQNLKEFSIEICVFGAQRAER